jgi:hypothetical protein
MIRRWIRLAKLRARRIGAQHVFEPLDLDEVLAAEELPFREAALPDTRT